MYTSAFGVLELAIDIDNIAAAAQGKEINERWGAHRTNLRPLTMSYNFPSAAKIRLYILC
jgi:hypothetical protein